MSEPLKSLDEIKLSDEDNKEVPENIKKTSVKDKLGRSYATGKRKDAIARVWIKAGSGKIVINGKILNEYFSRTVLQMVIH